MNDETMHSFHTREKEINKTWQNEEKHVTLFDQSKSKAT
jgi:hypothetical protein